MLEMFQPKKNKNDDTMVMEREFLQEFSIKKMI
jgi:hypothetical protein